MREPIMPQLDAEEFLRWEARQTAKFEVHHGFVVAFAGGTLDHGQIAFNVRSALARLFPDPCRTFGSGVKVRYEAAGFFYADAGVMCTERDPNSLFVDAPRLVAEVASPSTRAYDLVEKRAAYRAIPSLECYLIVHTHIRRLELDLRTANVWTTETCDEGEVYLGNGALVLDEVYARSSLQERERSDP